MALRATRYWRSMLNGLRGHRSFATTAETLHGHDHHPKSRIVWRGEHAPICMVLGMIMVAVTIGAQTAKQHLVYSPAVQVTKKKRESVPEVEDPDAVVGSADKFVNKSFLRKVAHIQYHDRVLPSVRPDPFTRSREVETLKSTGVRTSSN